MDCNKPSSSHETWINTSDRVKRTCIYIFRIYRQMKTALSLLVPLSKMFVCIGTKVLCEKRSAKVVLVGEQDHASASMSPSPMQASTKATGESNS